MTRWMPRTKAEIEDLVCEHSLIYSRGTLGFTELSDEEKRMFKPVRQRLVRTHPVDRPEVAVSVFAYRHDRRLAGARGAGLHPRPDRARDAAAVHLFATNGGSLTW